MCLLSCFYYFGNTRQTNPPLKGLSGFLSAEKERNNYTMELKHQTRELWRIRKQKQRVVLRQRGWCLACAHPKDHPKHIEYHRRRSRSACAKRCARRSKKVQLAKANAFLQSVLAAGCSRCEEKHPSCLDFHHSDPTTKTKAIGHLRVSGCSVDRLKIEVEKCVILCANCHRKHHWLQLQAKKERKQA